VTRYNVACRASISDLLLHGKDADCQAADPTGLRAISLAKEVRRTLKALDRRGRISPKLQHEIDALHDRRDFESAAMPQEVRLSVPH